MKKLSAIIDAAQHSQRPKNLSTEFQVYGVYLCEELGDTNYPLYMRLSKTVPRGLLEEALTFCKAYTTAKSKPKLFLWKLKQLRDQAKLDKSI